MARANAPPPPGSRRPGSPPPSVDFLVSKRPLSSLVCAFGINKTSKRRPIGFTTRRALFYDRLAASRHLLRAPFFLLVGSAFLRVFKAGFPRFFRAAFVNLSVRLCAVSGARTLRAGRLAPGGGGAFARATPPPPPHPPRLRPLALRFHFRPKNRMNSSLIGDFYVILRIKSSNVILLLRCCSFWCKVLIVSKLKLIILHLIIATLLVASGCYTAGTYHVNGRYEVGKTNLNERIVP